MSTTTGPSADTIEGGLLTTCTACAVALGADPEIAPFVAALVSFAVRFGLPFLFRRLAALVAPKPSTGAPVDGSSSPPG